MANQSISAKEYARIYYIQNREKLRARSSARYHAKRDEILAQQKLRRENNLEQFHAIERQRYWQRPEVMRQRSKAYYQENKESHYKGVQRYREAHREQEKEWKRRWKVNHPEQRRVIVRNNRDMRRRKGNGHFTLDQLLAKYEFHGWRCYLCQKPVTFQTSHPDHRKPLSRGGSNWIANIAPACVRCNLSKGGKTEAEHRAKRKTPRELESPSG